MYNLSSVKADVAYVDHQEHVAFKDCFVEQYNEVKNHVEPNATGKIKYLFRRPKFPIICAAGNEVISAASTAAFQRQIARVDLHDAKVIDIVDATGEGWALHADFMIVSPLTLRKSWKKIEIIRLFNESNNARRIGATYPEAYVPRRSLVRIIAEVAALAARSRRTSRSSRSGLAPPAERQS